MSEPLSPTELDALRSFLDFRQRWLRDGLTREERKMRRLGLIERVPGEGPLMFRLTDAGKQMAAFGELRAQPGQNDCSAPRREKST